MEGQKFTMPSLTVPGQAVSVSELYRRYNSGSLPDIGHTILDHEEDFDSFDPTDMSVFDAYEQSREYDRKMAKFLKDKEAKQMAEDEKALFARLKAKYESKTDDE